MEMLSQKLEILSQKLEILSQILEILSQILEILSQILEIYLRSRRYTTEIEDIVCETASEIGDISRNLS